MRIYYINHKKETLFLSGEDFIADGESLFDWDFEKVGESYILGFVRKIVEFNLPILVRGHDREEFSRNLRRIHDIVSIDLENMRPGKLYIADTEEYLPCYFAAAAKSRWDDDLREAVVTYSVVTDAPGWHKDFKYTFSSEQSIGVTDGLNYSYNYPYNYTFGANIQVLVVNSVAGSDFELVIYGPVTNPDIRIGENVYAIGTDTNPIVVYGGSFIVIDSIAASVTHNEINGKLVDRFNDRIKEYDIFAKIPPGNSAIQTNCFFDLTVKQKRNEPTWNL